MPKTPSSVTLPKHVNRDAVVTYFMGLEDRCSYNAALSLTADYFGLSIADVEAVVKDDAVNNWDWPPDGAA